MTHVLSPQPGTEHADMLTIPMHVRTMGTPPAAALTKIKKVTGADVQPSEAFGFESIASTDALDSYHTRMDVRTSLENFRRDLQAGAALLDSHDVFRLPIGTSYGGEIVQLLGGKAEGADATSAVSGSFYIPRGINVSNGQSTDDYIRGIETGIYRKMSIGFGGPEMEILCDVDGSNLYDWDSPYYPGMPLENGKRVTYTVYGARLYESSLVYKNATPGALVQRLQALVTDRRIPPGEAARLGGVFGVRFDVPNFRLAFSDRATEGASDAFDRLFYDPTNPPAPPLSERQRALERAHFGEAQPADPFAVRRETPAPGNPADLFEDVKR